MSLKSPEASLALFAALLCWTAVKASTLPPITDATDKPTRPGAIVWADLLTDDPAAAMIFYQAVFGWSMTKADDPGYTLIRNGGRAIGGIAEHRPRGAAGSETQWLVSMSVDDVDAALRIVENAGGEIFEGPDTVQERGRMAIVADPTGGVFAIYDFGSEP